jgi:5-formyltetrahydrofolate cyclo-ligase
MITTKSKAQNKPKNKQDLRKMFLKKLKTQKEVNRLQKSNLIKKKLFASKEYRKAKTILFYASFDGEVDTKKMVKQAQKHGKRIALPVILEDRKSIIPSEVYDLNKELGIGLYGIKQPRISCLRPVDLSDIDLVIVPGVAFAKNGCRLGRGKGYYDRFLKKLPSKTATFGLAFDFQVVESLPFINPRDIPVKKVIAC